jgi:hypothetical protein
MKPLAIALSRVGRVLQGRDGGSELTNAQCKAIQNCHNEYLPVQPMYPNKNEKKQSQSTSI